MAVAPVHSSLLRSSPQRSGHCLAMSPARKEVTAGRPRSRVSMGGVACRGPGQMASHLLRGRRAAQPGARHAGQQRLRQGGALAQQHCNCEMLTRLLPGNAEGQCMSLGQHHSYRG